MDYFRQALVETLENRKEELEDYKLSFRNSVRIDIDTSTFEQNAISTLLVMKDLKTQIRYLEAELERYDLFNK